MSAATWGLWVEEYWHGYEGLQRFWLRGSDGEELTYSSPEEAADACREWFGQVPEHMTVREHRR